jgi:hypothetical protein
MDNRERPGGSPARNVFQNGTRTYILPDAMANQKKLTVDALQETNGISIQVPDRQGSGRFKPVKSDIALRFASALRIQCAFRSWTARQLFNQAISSLSNKNNQRRKIWQLSNDELLNASRQVEERRLQLGSHGSRMNVQPPMVSPPPMGPPPVVRSELEVEIGYAVRRLRAALRELRLDTERACAGPHTLAVPHPIRGPFVLWCC